MWPRAARAGSHGFRVSVKVLGPRLCVFHAQIPAQSIRAHVLSERPPAVSSVSMVATGGEKKTSGAKINVKKGDFDITAPTKRVGDAEAKVKKIIPAPPIVSEIGTPSQKCYTQ